MVIFFYPDIEMNLLKQLVLSILLHFKNPLYDPVILDKTLLNMFEHLTDLDISKISTLREKVYDFPAEDFFSTTFRANLLKHMDALISLLRTNEATIKGLLEENEELKKQIPTEPVIVMSNVFEEFLTKLDTNAPILRSLIDLRNTLYVVPKNDFANLIKCIDVIILTLRHNDDTIARLIQENEELKKRHRITTISLPDVMTIPFTMYLV